jgi:hypothetical protein
LLKHRPRAEASAARRSIRRALKHPPLAEASAAR